MNTDKHRYPENNPAASTHKNYTAFLRAYGAQEINSPPSFVYSVSVRCICVHLWLQTSFVSFVTLW